MKFKRGKQRDEMKKKMIMYITAVGMSIALVNKIAAECAAKHKEHHDQYIAQCFYTQEDIMNMRKKNRDRCTDTNDSCLFCGCSLDNHSSGSK
jgi:hypothetical protein